MMTKVIVISPYRTKIRWLIYAISSIMLSLITAEWIKLVSSVWDVLKW